MRCSSLKIAKPLTLEYECDIPDNINGTNQRIDNYVFNDNHVVFEPLPLPSNHEFSYESHVQTSFPENSFLEKAFPGLDLTVFG